MANIVLMNTFCEQGMLWYDTCDVTVVVLQRVLRDILTEKCPRVTAHLDALEMDISLFSFNWFLTLFIENIPIPTVLRIWDAFLFEGIKVSLIDYTHWYEINGLGVKQAERLFMVISQQCCSVLSFQLVLGYSNLILAALRCALTSVPFNEL